MPEHGVIVVAIWCGESKPTVLNDFLQPFVTEMIDIINNGISINGFHLKISIRCFVCDTPARSYIKGKSFFYPKKILAKNLFN